MTEAVWLAPHVVGLCLFAFAVSRPGFGFDGLAAVIGLAIVYHAGKLAWYLRGRATLPPNAAAGQRLALALSAPFLVGLPVALAVLVAMSGPGTFRSVGALLFLAVPVLSWGGGLLIGALGNQLGRHLVPDVTASPSDRKPGA